MPPAVGGALLAWLLEVLEPMPRTRVKQLLRHGRVVVNGTPITRFDHPLQPGDRVTISREGPNAAPPSLESSGLHVVAIDEHLIVVDKPVGLLSVATEGEKAETAFALLNTHLRTHGEGRPFVVHRIDRETSGLLLFARSAEVRDRLQADWQEVEKTYFAVVEGTPRPAEGAIRNELLEGRNLRVRACRPGETGKPAVTRYQVLASAGRYSLVEVTLETGRKHQIRVHLAGLHCPVVGDKLYGAQTDPAGRLGLHACRLELTHPGTGRRVRFESPLPRMLQRVIDFAGSRPGRAKRPGD